MHTCLCRLLTRLPRKRLQPLTFPPNTLAMLVFLLQICWAGVGGCGFNLHFPKDQCGWIFPRALLELISFLIKCLSKSFALLMCLFVLTEFQNYSRIVCERIYHSRIQVFIREYDLQISYPGLYPAFPLFHGVLQHTSITGVLCDEVCFISSFL